MRRRLSERLKAVGLIVDPYDMWTQEGGYRSVHWDLARWGATGRWANPTGKQYSGDLTVYSWDTMTDCVRFGVTLTDGSDDSRMMNSEVEIHRADPG